MKKERRKFSADFKAKVAIEAIQERETIERICKKYELHPSQINAWKKELKDNTTALFSGDYNKRDFDQSAMIDELYKQIGQLKVENDFLKKKLL